MKIKRGVEYKNYLWMVRFRKAWNLLTDFQSNHREIDLQPIRVELSKLDMYVRRYMIK